jgi:hypothetical protein
MRNMSVVCTLRGKPAVATGGETDSNASGGDTRVEKLAFDKDSDIDFAESSLGSRARCTRQVGTAPDRESSDFNARNGVWPSGLLL